ncbi:MAG TPA: DUF2059 domain-containing protein [Candidatus Limnocylindrales bacterium]|nr:DUF2059 domain-containing protein [Candidatus Limnocylindrales bacterium]
MNVRICCTFLALMCSVAAAQKPAASPRPGPKRAAASVQRPSREQVIKLLGLLQIPDGLQMTLDAMKVEMKSEAEQMFRDKINSPTAEQLKTLNSIVDEEFAQIKMDDLIEQVVPIYQNHLTRSDVAALTAFYTSPVGQKIRREQPAMVRESMQVTAEGQKKKMQLLVTKLELRIQRLIQDGQAGPGQKK